MLAVGADGVIWIFFVFSVSPSLGWLLELGLTAL